MWCLFYVVSFLICTPSSQEQIKKADLLLESIRHRKSLVLLELPITGMCLPTQGFCSGGSGINCRRSAAVLGVDLHQGEPSSDLKPL
jgi:hypothetical protein